MLGIRYCDLFGASGPGLKRVLPSLPKKKAFGRFNAKFLEKRAHGLQTYMQAVAKQQPKHRVLTQELHQFLESPTLPKQPGHR